MNLQTYWIAIILLGVGTFVIRLSFIQVMDRFNPPQVVHRLLRFIPAAVLPAIIAPALCFQGSQLDLTLGNPRLIAGILAALIAWKTKNMILPIVVGMGTLWILQAVF